MRPLPRLMLIVLAGVAVTCQSSAPPPPADESGVQSPTVTIEPTPQPGVSLSPEGLYPTASAPAPTPTLLPTPDSIPLPLPHYSITATLDYPRRTLTVNQKISYTNLSSEPISELLLVVQPNWRPGVFSLTRFDINQYAVEDYALAGIRLPAQLKQPLLPEETVSISLGYEIKLPSIQPSGVYGPTPFGFTPRQINLTDWYPFLPPYVQGKGWLVHNPWYYGEHLVYPMADFDVTLRLENAPQGTLVAASAPDTGEAQTHRYQLDNARNFVLSISPDYLLRQETISDTLVLGYSFPLDDTAGQAALDTTVEALQLYSSLIGPYPYETLSLVQGDFDHGMEYSGLFFLSKALYNTYNGSVESFLISITAHETAHQWWFGLVGNDQALEPWLDEALCTYGEALFYENLHPEGERWWWAFRVNYYQPAGFVDSSIYSTSGYRPYRDAVYLNGAIFLDELRNRIGDEAFFAFLQDYTLRNRGSIATTAVFFKSLEDHTDTDWSDLEASFFQGSTP